MVARRVRAGFTLLELLLVVAIIVLVGAMLVPNFVHMGDNQNMTACLDGVRGAWLTARSQSIEDSRPYRFSVSGGRYRVAPDSDDWWPTAPSNPDKPAYVLESALPQGVRFGQAGQQVGAAPDNAPEEKIGSPANWTTKAIFLPDGSAHGTDGDNVDIDFNIPGTRPRRISLRGLTGTISVKVLGE